MTKRSLSTAEVARIVGMREARVREWVRFGLCRPPRRGRGYAFSFQDLVVLRAARDLAAAGVPAVRIRRALAALSAELPARGSLSGLRIFAEGRRVAVREGDTTWHPESGQTVLDLELDRLAAEVRRAREAPRDPPSDAQAAFERGVDLEDVDRDAAARAYARALSLDPQHVDACINLGRIRHDEGDVREAERLYERALVLAPDDPVIHFNLALVLEDTQGLAPAIARYERAIALDPDFADAHYNLAGLCDRVGRGADAIRHYHAYKKLTGG